MTPKSTMRMPKLPPRINQKHVGREQLVRSVCPSLSCHFMKVHWKFLLGVALCAAVSTPTRAAGPVLGKSPRYCNPLPMVSDGASASGDVTVIRDNGKYYMYCTGGGTWVSDDLLNWTLHRVPNVPIAPHVVKYKGAFYMCGNDGPCQCVHIILNDPF